MAPVEDNDSGMESPADSQPADPDGEEAIVTATPDKPLELDQNVDDEPDETFLERLWGLTEMFPEPVRQITYSVATKTQSGIQSFYGFSRNAVWIIFSSSIILFAPVIFEVERAQIDEIQRSQQKQLVLGPNTAIPGAGVPPILPPLQR